MLQRLKDYLALTETEQKVILFLSISLLAGAGIRLYQGAFPEVKQFDYRAADSTFAALSEKLQQTPVEAKQEESGRLININTASKERLMTLPGIGEIIAERILLHRDDVGTFRSVEELRSIKGISKKKFEQIKPLISVH